MHHHLWISLVHRSHGGNLTVGPQRMVTADSLMELREQVGFVLATLGAKQDVAWDESVCPSMRAPGPLVIPIEPDDEGFPPHLQAGQLQLELFPCYSNGQNFTAPREPIAE